MLFLIVFASSHIRAWARQLKACRSLLQSIDAPLITNAFLCAIKSACALFIHDLWWGVIIEAFIRNITGERRSRIAVSVEKGRAALNGDMLRLSGLLQSVVPIYTRIYMLSFVFSDNKSSVAWPQTHMRVYVGWNDVYDVFVSLFRLFLWDYIVSRIYFLYLEPYLLTNGLT